MRRPLLPVGLVVAALAMAGCSDPSAPSDSCDNAQGLGIPALDLTGSLRSRGATVTELGERLALTVFSVPTQVLDVNGAEVLVWEYCLGGGEDLARDLGKYGIGVFAERPPPLTLGPGEHLWTMAQLIAFYDGADAAIVALMTDVMGDELAP